mmetsp:Transcript_25297/g.58961  ORF Transcript_25297/g.58961 Transcript_25297/m.58961 type:complete len:293 (-) Transcript_25297:401-1279(-)
MFGSLSVLESTHERSCRTGHSNLLNVLHILPPSCHRHRRQQVRALQLRPWHRRDRVQLELGSGRVWNGQIKFADGNLHLGAKLDLGLPQTLVLERQQKKGDDHGHNCRKHQEQHIQHLRESGVVAQRWVLCQRTPCVDSLEQHDQEDDGAVRHARKVCSSGQTQALPVQGYMRVDSKAREHCKDAPLEHHEGDRMQDERDVVWVSWLKCWVHSKGCTKEDEGQASETVRRAQQPVGSRRDAVLAELLVHHKELDRLPAQQEHERDCEQERQGVARGSRVKVDAKVVVTEDPL